MTEVELRELCDRQAIAELPARYCSLVWRKAGAAMAGLFTEDGIFDANGEVAHGRAELEKAFQKVALKTNGPYPYIHNLVIDLSGDTARGTCQSDVRFIEEGRMKLNGGFYEDSYVRTTEGWRFSARVFQHRFSVWVPSDQGR